MNVSIGKYIYQALSAITGLQVCPVMNITNTPSPTTPYLVYQRTSIEPKYTKDLFTGEVTHNYSITVVDDEYDKTIVLAQLAINALMALSHTNKEDIRFNQVMPTDLSEDFQEGLFVQIIQIEINTTEI